MDEDSNGGSAQTTEGAQGVAGRLGVKPEDGLSFGDHDERLEGEDRGDAAGRRRLGGGTAAAPTLRVCR